MNIMNSMVLLQKDHPSSCIVIKRFASINISYVRIGQAVSMLLLVSLVQGKPFPLFFPFSAPFPAIFFLHQYGKYSFFSRIIIIGYL